MLARPSTMLFCGISGIFLIAEAFAAPQAPRLVHLMTIREYAPGRKLVNPQAVAVDRESGEIFVTDSGNGQVVVFSPDGHPRFRFSHRVRNRDSEAAGEPLGIALGPEGEIFLSDARSELVDILDYRGRKTGSLDLSSRVEKGKPSPGKLASDAAGNLYIIERTSGQIFIFDRSLKFVRQFGGRGREAGKFVLPNGISLTRPGHICVSDAQGMPVQVFEPSGKLVSSHGVHESSPSGFSFPCGVATDPSGQYWVADRFRQEVKLFDPEFKHLMNYGGLGEGEEDLFFPSDLKVSLDGSRLFVVEGAANQVKVFRIEFPEGAGSR